MRTTLNLDDDVLTAARSLARASERSLGQVISDLVRRGLEPISSSAERPSGFPVFEVSAETPPITLDTVRRALDEED